jgi:CRISPR-associated protein Csd1
MLHLLVDYARAHGLEAEPGFKPKYVRWGLCFSSQGEFLNVIQELGEVGSKRNPGQLFARCPDLSQPELIGGRTARSHFLIEAAEVVALFGKNASEAKTREKHDFFVALLQTAGSVMPELAKLGAALADDDVLGAIRNCMDKQDNPKLKPTDKVTFSVEGRFPVESSAWHNWWRTFREALASEKSGDAGKAAQREKGPWMRCFATGELVQPAATHPKIEGLADVGGQPSGTSLIGYDKEAFASYGLEKSANAAVSDEASWAYRTALNELLRNHSIRLGDAKVVYWFKGKIPREDDPLVWLQEGSGQEELNAQQRARSLMQAIRSGHRPELFNNTYYALSLSGSGGRVMVRDWMEGQFPQLAQNISAWFDDLAIVHRDGGTLAPAPKLLAVLGATVRDLGELSAPLVAKMWRAAVQGELIPYAALAQALARVRIEFIQDAPPSHARMGLIKAYHARKRSNQGGELMSEDLQPHLNELHPHPAYHCGRLMAVLAALQRRALGDIGAGVVQRYYAAASSTPALVLGRLTRTSQFHLNKLEPGLAYWYEDKISNIWGRIKDTLPRTLDLEEQSLFALGYYQQLAALRAGRPDTQNEKRPKEENRE